ncbi:murein L,D-transpeptidase catalytic domain family protein [Flavobacterium granuli]|uniref:L,D-transpeptidase catalytic domain n=1 Tax=Flavobacterium granuli TaxID=280093 RepID=A0A1M5MYQ5_9FLAO|nr:murein L,D-transpeptidase catalytic domain family protein [Flavobacterium granuli]PRZ25114.1 L,D-transpeptidase-like protein [Flavobacterium granuli]SHG81873.1 L,D-transpeptidase catalytic domain [Flavobacterium granuli]
MIYKIFPFVMLAFISLSPTKFFFDETKKASPFELTKVGSGNEEEAVYNNLNSNQYSLPNLKSFTEALKGFNRLKEKGVISKNILTLIDFSLSSNAKRLWVIDLNTNTILYNSLVAHGRNTGDEFAASFSNAAQSFKSSLGFYATGEIYIGKHGKSLRLDGLEKGINSNARDRAVVIHGADYVSDSFIKNNKRLGRSLGCPAVPLQLVDDIIQTIKDKSCLFIYYPSPSYKEASKLVS